MLFRWMGIKRKDITPLAEINHAGVYLDRAAIYPFHLVMLVFGFAMYGAWLAPLTIRAC